MKKSSFKFFLSDLVKLFNFLQFFFNTGTMAGINFNRIVIDESGASLVFFIPDQCLYKTKRTRPNVTYFQCTEAGCAAKGKIVANGQFERTNALIEHSHDHNHSNRAAVETAYARMRQLVRERLDRKVYSLYTEVQDVLPPEVGSYLNWANVRLTLQRIRNRMFPACANLAELQTLLEDTNGQVYQQLGMLHGGPLYVGSVNDQMMFANVRLIDHLPDLVDIFIDGTFKVTPFKSRQLLVILAELQGRPRPIFYAIMEAQDIEAYEIILRFFQDTLLTAQRTVISCMKDFEQAITAAVSNVWPNAASKGCNFHFNQALERKAKSTRGLGGKLAAGTKYRKILLMFMRISLLPIHRINAGFEAILGQILYYDTQDEEFDGADWDEFVTYFRHTWFVRFPPELWCVSDEFRRTNNNVEGHNRKIKIIIPKNPSAWKFLVGIRALMIDATNKFESDRRNEAPPPRDLSRLTVPLANALRQLANGDIDEQRFLRIMAAS
jgi:hypothetical protein